MNEKLMKPVLKESTLMGIMVNGDSSFALTKWEEAKAMIKLSNSHGYGAVIWYGKSVVSDYRAEFHELWGNINTQ